MDIEDQGILLIDNRAGVGNPGFLTYLGKISRMTLIDEELRINTDLAYGLCIPLTKDDMAALRDQLNDRAARE